MKVSTKTVITLTGSDVFQAVADYVEKHGQSLDLKAIEEEMCEAVDSTDEYHFVSHADAPAPVAPKKKPRKAKSEGQASAPEAKPAEQPAAAAPEVPVVPVKPAAVSEPAGTTADQQDADDTPPFDLPAKASPEQVTKADKVQPAPKVPKAATAPPAQKSIAVGQLFKQPK